MKPKLYSSKNWLEQRFVTEGKTIAEMAKEARCSGLTIRRALESAGLIR